METLVLDHLSTALVDTQFQTTLSNWIEAITAFEVSYSRLVKNTIRLMAYNRVSIYLGQCLKSQPAQLLDAMRQELETLSQHVDELPNFTVFQLHTSRLQQLTYQANQLINLMNQSIN